jgi:hypothetical protein
MFIGSTFLKWHRGAITTLPSTPQIFSFAANNGIVMPLNDT